MEMSRKIVPVLGMDVEREEWSGVEWWIGEKVEKVSSHIESRLQFERKDFGMEGSVLVLGHLCCLVEDMTWN